MDKWHISQYLFRGKLSDRTWLQDIECNHMGEDKPTSQYLMPIFQILHRVRYLGEKDAESTSQIQLRSDERVEWRQANDGCVANASYRSLGKDLR